MERQSPLPLSPPCTSSHQQLATLQEARLSGHYANQRWTLLPGGASGDCSGSSTSSVKSAISHRVREGIPRKRQKEKPCVRWTLPRPSLRIASAAIDHIYRATVTEKREEEVCCGRQSRSGWERKERQSRTEKAREIWRQREGDGVGNIVNSDPLRRKINTEIVERVCVCSGGWWESRVQMKRKINRNSKNNCTESVGLAKVNISQENSHGNTKSLWSCKQS